MITISTRVQCGCRWCLLGLAVWGGVQHAIPHELHAEGAPLEWALVPQQDQPHSHEERSADPVSRAVIEALGSANVTGTINATLPRMIGRLDGTVNW